MSDDLLNAREHAGYMPRQYVVSPDHARALLGAWRPWERLREDVTAWVPAEPFVLRRFDAYLDRLPVM